MKVLRNRAEGPAPGDGANLRHKEIQGVRQSVRERKAGAGRFPGSANFEFTQAPRAHHHFARSDTTGQIDFFGFRAAEPDHFGRATPKQKTRTDRGQKDNLPNAEGMRAHALKKCGAQGL